MGAIVFVCFGSCGCLGSALGTALCINFHENIVHCYRLLVYVLFFTRRIRYSVHCGLLWLAARCSRRSDLTKCQSQEEKRRGSFPTLIGWGDTARALSPLLGSR